MRFKSGSPPSQCCGERRVSTQTLVASQYEAFSFAFSASVATLLLGGPLARPSLRRYSFRADYISKHMRTGVDESGGSNGGLFRDSSRLS